MKKDELLEDIIHRIEPQPKHQRLPQKQAVPKVVTPAQLSVKHLRRMNSPDLTAVIQQASACEANQPLVENALEIAMERDLDLSTLPSNTVIRRALRALESTKQHQPQKRPPELEEAPVLAQTTEPLPTRHDDQLLDLIQDFADDMDEEDGERKRKKKPTPSPKKKEKK